jgi:regulator of nucleoside diphosphate kinase
MSAKKRPDIVVHQEDHEQLIELALKALGQSPGAATLLEEMERAKVVESDALPPNVLAMNDAAEFEYDGQTYRDFHLVWPNCADFVNGRISVLTPVGAALIGLSEGSSMWWPGQQGRVHRLTLNKVTPHRQH